MINLPYYLKSLKWTLPTAVMFGVVPGHTIFWGTWRAMTLFLPRQIFEIGDNFFWEFYQKLVVFFFEHYTGTKVSILSQKTRQIVILFRFDVSGLGSITGSQLQM